MKLVNGSWQRLSWQQAIDEIGDKLLEIRKTSGPDSVFWCGSSKASNEGSYLQRKFAAFWGTNNMDHQARICHSTTVAGVASTWGYGAMTNSYNDMHNSKAMLFVGSNAAEAHPVAMQHILRAKENGAKMIVVDPRFTRTAAHADIYGRLRPGTDVPFIYGLLWHIFKNGWEDKEYIDSRVWSMDDIRAEAENWPPDKVENVTGMPEAKVHEIAQTMAENRPGTIVWCMGGTQHHIGNNITRIFCVLQLALGNIGKAGGGANIFRGHDNVQGATDIGPNSHTLPGYYGLSAGAWQHWARVWGVDYEWLKARFDMSSKYDAGNGDMQYTMNIPGIPVSRWIDGILESKENLSQRDNFRAVFFQGHACNSQTRGHRDEKGPGEVGDGGHLRSLSDPYGGDERSEERHLSACRPPPSLKPTVRSPLPTVPFSGGKRLSSRLYESKPDHVILYLLAKKLGFADEMFKNIKVVDEEPLIEDILREINQGNLDHRLYGTESGKAPAAGQTSANFQHHNPDGRRWTLRRRILRPALAMLGYSGIQTSGHPHPL